MFSLVKLSLVLLVCFTLLWKLISYHWRRRALYKFSASVPGPSLTLPIIGNGLALGIAPESFLDNAEKLFKKYPSGFRLWMGSTLCYCVPSLDDLSTVLFSAKTHKKGFLYQLAEPSFRDGIVLSSGVKWRTHRRLVNKSLQPSILDGYVETFSSKSRILVDKMKKEVGGPKFKLSAYVGLCSTDLVCDTLMGITTNLQDEQNKEFDFHINALLKTCGIRTFKPWLYNDFIFKHSKYGKQQEKSKKFVYDFINAIIDERLEAHARNSANMRRRRSSTLEHLIEMTDESKDLTAEDLFDEILTLFVAAQEPISTVSNVLFLMLAIKQDIQDKVYRELENIFGESDRPVESEDLPKMNYLEMVIKETLRLFSPTLLFRTVTEDFELGGMTLPAGCNILFSPFFTHRLEEHWGPNPKIFDPDRFLAENVARRHPIAYIPFSAGLRSCAGQKYAMMAIKTVVAEVLRKYVLFTDQEESSIKIIGGFTTKPIGGFKIQIKNRV